MRLIISMGLLACILGTSPLTTATCHQGQGPTEPHVELHDLVAGKLYDGECSEATEISGTVTRVERDRKHRWVTVFRVRSDDGRDLPFDALKLKDNMRANVKEEFDRGIAEGDRVELSVYLCGEKKDEMVIDAIALFRPTGKD